MSAWDTNAAVAAALDLLSTQLQDFPRTQRHLDAARAALTPDTTTPIA